MKNYKIEILTNMAAKSCKNCSNSIEENFCSQCGQKKYKRINQQYVIDEVQYLAIHTNKGFFYSVKKILKNPGKTARDFIEGNRVNYYKPLNLAFLLSGLSVFISLKFLNFKEIMKEAYVTMNMPANTINDIVSFMTSYMSFISLLLLPIFSGVTYLLFRKWGQNYYEHIVMGSIFQCYYSIISILFCYPLLFIFNHDVNTFFMVSYAFNLIIPFLLVWFYKGFYPDKKLILIIGKVVLFFILLFILYVIVIILFAILSQILK